MSTEAQKRAKKKYKQQITRYVIECYPTEADIIAHLEKQENKTGFIKSLIRKHIQEERGRDNV